MDSNSINLNNYYEISFSLPYCGLTWCGFDNETIKNIYITPLTCFPTK